MALDKMILFIDGALMAVSLLAPLYGKKLGTWSDHLAVGWIAFGMAITGGVLVYFGYS